MKTMAATVEVPGSPLVCEVVYLLTADNSKHGGNKKLLLL